MFAVLLVFPTLTFLVLSYYTGYVVKTVINDVLRYTLPGKPVAAQVLRSELVYRDNCRVDITPTTRHLIKLARQKLPESDQCQFTFRDRIKPKFLAVSYCYGNKEYVRYYPRGKNLIFPPCKHSSTPPTSGSAKCYLLVQYFTKEHTLCKLVRQDVSKLSCVLEGPCGDWYGGSHLHSRVIYTHLYDTLMSLLQREGTPDGVEYTKVTFKKVTATGDKASVCLTKYLPRSVHGQGRAH